MNIRALIAGVIVSAAVVSSLVYGQTQVGGPPVVGQYPPAPADSGGNALSALMLKGLSVDNENFIIFPNNSGNAAPPAGVTFGASDVMVWTKNGVIRARYGSGESANGSPLVRDNCVTGNNAATLAGACLATTGDLLTVDDAGLLVVLSPNAAAVGDVLQKVVGNPDIGYGPVASVEVKRVSGSDVAYTNTATFANITGLTGYIIKAGKLYGIVGRFTITVGASAAADFKLQTVLAGVGSGAVVNITVKAIGSATTANTEMVEVADATSTGVLSIASSGTTYIEILGTVLGGSTDGTLAFQGAQNTATSGITTNVKIGSMAMLSRGS